MEQLAAEQKARKGQDNGHSRTEKDVEGHGNRNDAGENGEFGFGVEELVSMATYCLARL